MLDSIIYARDQYLAPESGLMAPKSCSIWIAGISDEDIVNDRINFWNNVYGFDMTPMKHNITKEPIYDIVSQSSIATDEYLVYNLNIQTAAVPRFKLSAAI